MTAYFALVWTTRDLSLPFVVNGGLSLLPAAGRSSELNRCGARGDGRHAWALVFVGFSRKLAAIARGAATHVRTLFRQFNAAAVGGQAAFQYALWLEAAFNPEPLPRGPRP